MALWLNYVKKSCLSFWHELLLHQRGASWSHVSGKLEGSQILEFLLQLCTIFEIFNIHSLPKITYNKYITNGFTLYKLYSDLLTTKIMYHQDTRFWYTRSRISDGSGTRPRYRWIPRCFATFPLVWTLFGELWVCDNRARGCIIQYCNGI